MSGFYVKIARWWMCHPCDFETTCKSNWQRSGWKETMLWRNHHLSPFKQYSILRIYLWSVFACKGDWRRESKHVIIALLLHTQTRFQEASGSRYPPSFRLLLRLLESLNWERSFFKKETSETESQQLQSNLYFHTKKTTTNHPNTVRFARRPKVSNKFHIFHGARCAFGSSSSCK